MSDNPKYSYTRIESLRFSIAGGTEGLHTVPLGIRTIIESGDWREFVVRETGEVVRYERFADFVTTQPLEGLGTDVATLRRLCSDDVAATDALDLVTANGRIEARDDLGHVRSLESNERHTPQENTTPGTLRRLRKDAPEIHARVLAGELSPHAGALEAGFRPRRVSVRTDDPASAARTLAGAYGERLGELVAALAVLA